MPFALLVALLVSLAIHLLALFGTDIELSVSREPPPLLAELKALPAAKPQPLPELPKPAPKAKPKPLKKPPPVTPMPSAAPVEPVASASPVLATPEASPTAVPASVAAATEEVPVVEPAPAKSRLPARGMIRYRVDRGDQEFVIGQSTQDWEVVDGNYRITAVTETSGLVALFKPLRIEMESRGKLTADGLQPESFMIRRGGRDTREKARFDWEKMQVTISNGAAQPLKRGSQDLLSFHYQLGFLPHPEVGNTLLIATGKKYVPYRIEVLGDEEIVIPAGSFHTLHLRAPGDSTTELWLAYDYLLLPVKIRHLDRDGDSFVEVATEIRLSTE